ncbi:DNA-directed DNA polymerase [Erwinia phage Stepyanka]|uniref:DNA-directed DNA polymerase n=1 Tax=Erwinia phage Stepyanka TaxID=2961688 RepID=A0A9E7T376_9CAUD|nr:DNA-directed DNA polymerase [Erwinia phage Stepyanka]
MLVTDIEANNLLEKVTKFHCGVIGEAGSLTKNDWFRPGDFSGYLDMLEAEVERDGLIVFHNGHKYDAPALTKLAKLLLNREFHLPCRNVLDTLVLSRLLYANIKDTDVGLLKSGRLPGRRFGSHALEAWGYRLGQMKGEYAEIFKKRLEEEGEEYHDGDEWVSFNEDMMEYNDQDVVVTNDLLATCLSHAAYFPDVGKPYQTMSATEFWANCGESVLLEHEAAWVLAKMERNGFPFNENAIQGLYAELSARRSELKLELIDTFGSWYRAKGGNTPFLHPRTGKPLSKYPLIKVPKQGGIYKKPKNKAQRLGLEPCELDTRDYIEGAPFTPVEHVVFNPSSRDHIQLKLQEAGWIPTEFTDKGAPKIDDEVLEHVRVDDPQKQRCIDLIKEYLMIQKRIGQAAEGDKAWLRYVQEDGKIHGSVNPNGAVTGRATHSFPNMGQVPGVRSPYGEQCRAAFGAEHHLDGLTGKPWVQAGIDASGLELRCLAHFMSKYDEGAYADVILNGDIHTVNQQAAELPTRDNAKTFIYGFLYGAGDEKIGQIVGAGKERGKLLKKKFLENTPAIAALREGIQQTLVKDSSWVGGEQRVTWKRRWIRGLDGRRIHIRSPHAALNSLLQSAGALICKLWVVKTEQLLLERGFKHGWDGDFAYMAWVHDEIQVACRTPEIAAAVVEIAQEAMRWVGEHWNFRCRLDTEGKIGPNWAVCH